MYETLAVCGERMIGQGVDAIVIFRCGELRCALDRAEVREITPVADFATPPATPPVFAGFLNLGGEAIGVVDAARLFGVAPDAEHDPLYRHVLILARAKLGLLVDRVEDVRAASEADVRASDPGASLNGCVIGEIDTPEGPAHLLSGERLLLGAEQARLQDLRAAEQARLDAAGAP